MQYVAQEIEERSGDIGFDEVFREAEEWSEGRETFILQVRLTHKYVGTYAYLDDFEEVGRAKVICKDVVHESGDACEPQTTTMVVEIDTWEPLPLNQLLGSFYGALDRHGCHHEWDCCGCRSYSVEDVVHIKDNRFYVVFSSSRNY
jgi:hypothetical protein